MPLQASTISPLTMAAFTIDYRLEGNPLQICAKRFRLDAPKKENSYPVTFLMIPGIGSGSEIWLPVIKYLFKAQAKSDIKFYVNEIWTVEWPNQGDAAVLNKDALEIHNADSVGPSEISTAVIGLLKTGLIDLANTKLIGVSHSGGGGGLATKVEQVGLNYCDATIFVEPPIFSKDVVKPHTKYIERSIAYNMSLPDVWPNIEAAAKWHKEHLPWKVWHPEAFEAFVQSHFRELSGTANDTGKSQGVTPKISKKQLAASFRPGHTLHESVEALEDLCAAKPTLFIFGERDEFWPKVLANSIRAQKESFKERFPKLTITTIPKCSHYVAQEHPRAVAEAMISLVGSIPLQNARL
ncbi:hypothetical protein M422DRAFT_254557 [Sphaerobolus stellatus SS14]|uniref:AB hydrolase-1 domain-containing protein n=1 Tax=Sphaerobolus stellatus (strain SS14) TaxID=990650 RepID=A0A0C9VV70_SPHS4|nr:hypothetical protein M422DRAFT_254557 [Sphaerobolus stellatus SS14]